MNGLALYNEIDDFAAAWLEQLIAAGQIAPGIVDRRSIEDLDPDYVRQFTQVHLFAGIGVWSRALRDAGWPDDRPVWTASEPCQPFSAAGKGGGFADERYLRPYAQHLIRECRPAIVLGEQVASKDGLAWLDVIQADLEGEDYAFGALDTCAAGFGAPHIRQRLHWCAIRNSFLADALSCGFEGAGGSGPAQDERTTERRESGGLVRLAQPHDAERRADLPGRDDNDGPDAGRAQSAGHAGAGGGRGGLAHSLRDGAEHRPGQGLGAQAAPAARDGSLSGQRLRPGEQGALLGMADTEGYGHERAGELGEPAGRDGVAHDGATDRPGPTNGFWRAADWLGCRDERWRPVEPGTFPLAHGAAARVGRLRGYGNAIVLPQATAFVETIQEYLGMTHAA